MAPFLVGLFFQFLGLKKIILAKIGFAVMHNELWAETPLKKSINIRTWERSPNVPKLMILLPNEENKVQLFRRHLAQWKIHSAVELHKFLNL